MKSLFPNRQLIIIVQKGPWIKAKTVGTCLIIEVNLCTNVKMDNFESRFDHYMPQKPTWYMLLC